ncbi:hypothetical protein WN944_015371 [Citrus x changshan-huyou]|uniref:Uncharacterized protein n=1 Tax=Citrus x changshan-huyou TaxID=2935761 RepID=A0AAP0MDX5_9ROSI
MTLQTIYLSNCLRLESLPSSLYKSKCLQDSYLDDCPNLQRLPDELGSLEALKRLYAEGKCSDRSTLLRGIVKDDAQQKLGSSSISLSSTNFCTEKYRRKGDLRRKEMRRSKQH